MNVAILGNFLDKQTAYYIAEAVRECGYHPTGVDIRAIIQDKGNYEGQPIILNEVRNLEEKPDMIIVTKGLEMTPATIKSIKEMHPNAKLVNWFFDKYLGDKPIWEQTSYFETLKLYDFYFCSLKGSADKLREKGFTNVYYLDEGCSADAHGEVYMNNYQKQSYGTDVAFVGSLGFMLQHSNRIKILQRVVREGFKTRIWGDIVCDPRMLPMELKQVHANRSVINLDHSKVVQASKINLGIDQDINLDMGHSARVYRVLCAGGLYLSTATKGLDMMFRTNKLGDLPTGEEEIVVFKDEDDMVRLIDFLLEHDDIRSKIAENGKKCVLEKHLFKHRIEEMAKVVLGE